MEKLLQVEDLCVGFLVKRNLMKIISHVSFEINEGEILGMIGETGCGKSVTGSTVLHLLPENAVVNGSIRYKGQEILHMKEENFNRLRGSEIVSIPQSPSTSLNPLMRIGNQVSESVLKRPDFVRTKHAAKKVRIHVNELFERLGLNTHKHMYNEYPCELSGGMCQRVLIAMGAITQPSLLVVDEPTKAIDWILRREVVDVLMELKNSMHSAMLLITHDIGVARELSDRIAVMYAGEIVEIGKAAEVLNQCSHPYTEGLIGSLPANGFKVMKGFMPSFEDLPSGCRFSDRCPYAKEQCKTEKPEMIEISEGHFVRCNRQGGGLSC